MNDRELIELAAKAYGFGGGSFIWCDPVLRCDNNAIITDGGLWDYTNNRTLWNPLTNDGDALRLAVKLGISLESDAVIEVGRFTYMGHTEGEYEMGVEAWKVLSDPIRTIKEQELYKDDPYAATRRAITRVAAEIGRTMP